MSLANISVKRPITTVMGALIIILLGSVAFTRLPIDLVPELVYPTLTVRTDYPHVGPQEVEDLLSRPIEEAVAAIAGVEEITSNSSEGQSSVRISFTWGTNLDEAADEVRTRIDRIRDRLPDGAAAPRVFKFDLTSFAIMYLGVSAKDMDAIELRQFTEERIERRFERVAGVASVELRGGLRRQIKVDLDRDRLLSLGLSADRVTQVLARENLNRPAGKVEEGNLDLYLRTVGEYRTADEVGTTVLDVRDGRPIHLRDVAEVSNGVEEITTRTRINGQPGIRLAIYKQSGSNTVQVAEGVRKEMALLAEDFPDVEIVTIIDTSDYIRQAINNVRTAALLGGLLAVVVLLFFLRSGRSTFVIATAIPISVIATFAMIYFAGYTLNIMTFGGLALGIGMLVDNSVVVLENIFRKREAGQDAETSAIVGTQEVATAITASTLTTMSVFLPIVFMEGVSGVMYQQLAAVVAFSLFASLVVALTLIPVLSAKILGQADAHPDPSKARFGKLYGISERLLDRLETRYRSALSWALSHRRAILLGTLVLFGVSLAVIPLIGSELFPSTDEGEVRVNAEMAVGTRLEVVDEAFKEIEAVVAAEVPEAASILTQVGGGGWRASGGHTGDVRISLVDQKDRTRTASEIASDLRGKLNHLPGMRVRVREGSGLFILRIAFGGGDERLNVEIQGFDLAEGRRLAEQVRQAIDGLPGVSDVRIARDAGRPERVIRINREKIARLGLSVRDVAEVVETNLAGSRATVLREAGREVDIFVRLNETDRAALGDIDTVTLVSASGDAVPLSSVVDVEIAQGPVIIDRKDQERVVNVGANLAGDRDLGSVAADIRQALRGIEVPEGFSVVLGGEFEDQQEAQRSLYLTIILALVLVYMVMAAQFENLFDPFVVMFAIPMAGIGVFLTLYLTGDTFNIQSYIGMVMLAGIVVNNAIVLVDYTNLLRRRDNLDLIDAVLEGSRRRLRPILMTTVTTVLGLLPLAIGLGEGSEVQASMARVVIGGLLTSTVITLFLVPTLYTGLSNWQAKRRGGKIESETAEAA